MNGYETVNDSIPGQTDKPSRRAGIMRGEAAATPGLRFEPDWTLTPGEVLQEELDARELTQAELAARANLSPKHINQVIKGVASLSPDTALRLERALGIPSNVWNGLEAVYQDQRARAKAREALGHRIGWLRHFPIRDLLDRNVLSKVDDQLTQAEKLLKFFQVADPDAYDKVWTEPVAAGFRRAQHTDVDPYASAVWVRLGERRAAQRSYQPYNAEAFSALLPRLRRLSLEPDTVALKNLQHECSQVGVAVEFEPEIKGSRVCGAARWINPTRAMILLSGRYKYHDSFWFTFFHEAAHILLHPKRRIVVDLDAKRGDDVDGHEGEADTYAQQALVPLRYLDGLNSRSTYVQIRKMANEAGVDVGIVAGQLAHRTGNYVRYNKLRRKIEIPATESDAM